MSGSAWEAACATVLAEPFGFWPLAGAATAPPPPLLAAAAATLDTETATPGATDVGVNSPPTGFAMPGSMPSDMMLPLPSFGIGCFALQTTRSDPPGNQAF
uniref:Putative secreted protein n=1 Tax=Anopheles triannulatus TaxID=58253 RepID=A0A2M4B2Q9_9DIPT